MLMPSELWHYAEPSLLSITTADRGFSGDDDFAAQAIQSRLPCPGIPHHFSALCSAAVQPHGCRHPRRSCMDPVWVSAAVDIPSPFAPHSHSILPVILASAPFHSI